MIVSSSARLTKKIANLFARDILSLRPKKPMGALIIGLIGNLGSGKTTFTQGFAQGLGIRTKVTSPTFLIIKNYKIKTARFLNFFHVDVYRLKTPKELASLNFKKIIDEPKNIVLVEWADKIKSVLPKNIIWAAFRHNKTESERIVEFRTD